MKITAIETIQVREYPNLLWVQVETDAGLTGLGETFRGADAVAGQIHGLTAPYLLGRDPLQIERHSHALVNGMLGFASTGAELRAASAIDIALWDILGQASGLPLYQLLGGLSRESVRVYNTCAGYTYNNRAARKREIASGDAARPEGPYDDQVAFVHAADELAHSLLEEGYGAMKIWPFDVFAEASGGLFISAADLALGLEPFEKIRRAVGDRIEIMCEFHSMWNLPTAKRIAHALEPLRPFWSEDPIRMNNVAALRDYAAATTIPWDRCPPSAICWKRRRHRWSCSTSAGAADCRRRARSPPWPRRISARSPRMTAPARWCSPPRCTCRCTRPTRFTRRSCGRSCPAIIASWSPSFRW